MIIDVARNIVRRTKWLGVPSGTLKKHIARGIPYNINDGKHRLYDIEECKQYLERWNSGRRWVHKHRLNGKPDQRPGVIYAMRIAGEKEIRYIGKSGDYRERKRLHNGAIQNIERDGRKACTQRGVRWP